MSGEEKKIQKLGKGETKQGEMRDNECDESEGQNGGKKRGSGQFCCRITAAKAGNSYRSFIDHIYLGSKQHSRDKKENKGEEVEEEDGRMEETLLLGIRRQGALLRRAGGHQGEKIG